MWQDYELPTQAEIDGARHEMRTDYRCVLDIFKVFNDLDLTEQERVYCALQIFYTDLPENIQAAAELMMIFINGNREENENAKEAPLMDWEQDLQVIIPPVNRILGKEIRELPYLHWWSFLGAFMEIGECTFNTFVGIRSKKSKGKKLEKYEQEIYKENRAKIDIKKRVDSETQRVFDDILQK